MFLGKCKNYYFVILYDCKSFFSVKYYEVSLILLRLNKYIDFITNHINSSIYCHLTTTNLQ